MAARNPFQLPEVKSRRGGPVKQPLSRDVIVRATLELLTRQGLEQVSLRKVAAALETGPASLYAYVEDLQELYILALDRALGDVQTVGDKKQPWRERLGALLRSYFHVLSRSPGVAQLALTTVATGPNGLRIVEALLGLLEEGGVEATKAAWAVDLISLYVTGLAAEQSHRRRLSTEIIGSVATALSLVTVEEHPRIWAVREQLLAGDGPERFLWAVDAVLNGILQTPRTPLASNLAAAPESVLTGKPRKPRAKKKSP